MATRYWVGGSGTWDATSTTNWAASTGGTAGASAPTSADNVIIDSASGSGSITLAPAATSGSCLDITITTTSLVFGINAFIAAGQQVNIYGSVSFVSGVVLGSYSNIIMNMSATVTGKTINLNGGTPFFTPTFNGVGGSWTLLSSLNGGSGQITLTNGTLNLNGFTAYYGTWICPGTGTFVLNGGTGIIANLQYTNSWFGGVSSVAGLTVNCSATTIQFGNVGGTINFANLGSTYGNFTFNPGSTTNYNFITSITVAGTVSMQSPATTPFTVTLLSGATFSCNNWTAGGSSPNRMTLTASSASQATLTRATSGTNTINYAIVSYINGNLTATGGGAVVWNFTNSLNAGNNTGLTGLASVTNRLSNTGTLSTNGTFDETSLSAGSISFNGTSQYLTFTNNTALGTSDFTMEVWVYPTGQVGTNSWIYGWRNGADTSPYLQFAGGGRTVYFGGDITNYLVSSSGLPLNAWTHIAVTRIGTAFTMYFNGVSVATGTSSQNFSYSGATGIGQEPNLTHNYYLQGYLSNFRIVVGTAIYTAAFNPPQEILPAVAGTNFLLNVTDSANFIRDNSPNNITVTNNNTALYNINSPFGINSAGSISFNGTSQYLSFTNNVAFGSGSFTLEVWAYPTATPSINFWIYGYRNGADTSPMLFINSSSQPIFGGDVTNILTSSTSLTTNAWSHIAVVRNGTAMAMYINGVSVATATSSQNFSYTGTNNIGFANSGSYYWTGYLSNFRIVPGTAVYTGAFTPPTAPLVSILNTSMLLNVYSSATFLTDSSTYNLTVTNNGAATYNNLTTPFATAKQRLVGPAAASGAAIEAYNQFDELSLAAGAVQFAGNTNQCLSATSTIAFNFGTVDFTAECWFYPTSTTSGAYETLITTSYPADAQGFFFGTFNTQMTYLLGNGSWFVISTPAGTFNLNAWNHAAFCRSGTTYNLYLNGIRVDTVTNATALTYTQNNIAVGGRSGTQVQIGYMSQVRVVNGTALYTGTTYTVPSIGILPSVANTVLLLNNLTSTTFTQDSSPNRFTVTNNVSCVWNANGPFNRGATALMQRQVNEGTLQVTNQIDENTGIV